MLQDDRAATRIGQLCSMRIERTLDTVLVRLQGDFDLACVEQFGDELDGALEYDTKMLVLDLRGLEFIDSTGLQMLVTLDAKTREEGLNYAVICEPGAVRGVLAQSGLDGVLPVVNGLGAVPNSDSPVSSRRMHMRQRLWWVTPKLRP